MNSRAAAGRGAIAVARAGAIALLATAGCAPALDWREVRPDGGTLVALLPCKPDAQSRPVQLAGATATMQVLGCQADGITWGVSSTDVGTPGRVAAALDALRAARVRNLGGSEQALGPARVAGMTPYPNALRFTVDGRRPDGSALREHALVFAHGTRVFHAAALGGAPSADAIELFFGGLKLRP